MGASLRTRSGSLSLSLSLSPTPTPTPTHPQILCGFFSPTGKQVLTGSADGTVRVWQAKTGACKSTFKDAKTGFFEEGVAVVSLAMHPDSAKKVALAGGVDGTARLCSVEKGKFRTLLTLAHFNPEEKAKAERVMAMGGAATGEREGGAAAASAAGAAAKKEEAEDGDGEGEGGEEGDECPSVEGVAFSPEHSWVATGCTDGLVKVWDTKSGACRTTMNQGEGAGVTALRFLSGHHILTAAADGALRLWDARTGELLQHCGGGGLASNGIDVVTLSDGGGGDGGSSNSGKVRAVSAGDDGVARVFDLDL